MPLLDMTIKVFGRPVKPVALGLLIICLTIVWTEAAMLGAFIGSWWRIPLAVLASCAVGTFAWGCVARSQQVAEFALLTAAATMIFRSTGLFLVFGPGEQRAWLSFGVGVIAVGSYILERADNSGRTGRDAA